MPLHCKSRAIKYALGVRGKNVCGRRMILCFENSLFEIGPQHILRWRGCLDSNLLMGYGVLECQTTCP